MITNIRLQNFRSYQDASFEFEDGVNVVVGPNASGKTNLLEAVLMIAQGKSYRARDVELIRQGEPWARIDSDTSAGQRTVKLERIGDTASKTYLLDDQSYSRLHPSKGLPVVLFEPEHLLMLGGSPELRRSFLDGLIAQTLPGYDTVLRQYKRALAQRNRLLKSGPDAARSQLFAWDIRLSELGSQMVVARTQMIEQINQQAPTTYSELAKHKTDLSLAYSAAVDPQTYASSLLKKLQNDQELDLLRGFTAAGPHREDIHFYLHKQPMAITASRGEVRTTLLTLKIIELKIIEAQRDQKPLLLLDDVFSELDGVRRKALTEFMRDYQTFITTTDADLVVKNFAQNAAIIAIGERS